MQKATDSIINCERDEKQMDNKYAPIVLFAYNRLSHLKETIECLKANDLASESDLIVVSDGYKNDDGILKVNEVRDYLKTINGFAKVRIIERKKNYGLGKNIICAINSLFKKYDSIIVLEDDIVTSDKFLLYMNSALKGYRDDKTVMAVSGYTAPFDKNGVEDYFFLPWFDPCGAWATWKDRWQKYERNSYNLLCTADKKMIYAININGTSPDMWDQVINNYLGRIRTWAIFYSVMVCKERGMVLYSQKSLCNNIGFDGSGDNCGISNTYDAIIQDGVFDESKFPRECRYSTQAIKNYVIFNRNRFKGKEYIAYLILKLKTGLFYLVYHR